MCAVQMQSEVSYVRGHCVYAELGNGRCPIPETLFSIQVQRCALIYKGWNGTRPVSQKKKKNPQLAQLLLLWRCSEWMHEYQMALLCLLHVKPHLGRGDLVESGWVGCGGGGRYVITKELRWSFDTLVFYNKTIGAFPYMKQKGCK